MNRRNFLITAGVATVSLLSGCLDQNEEDEQPGSQTVESYPIGFNERSVSPNTVTQNHIETTLDSDSVTSELKIETSEYTERTVGKKDGELRSTDVYINESDQAQTTLLSRDERTYTRDRTQANMYSIEEDRIVSAETVSNIEQLNVVLSSIIIRTNGLDGDTIVYNIVGESNNSQLDSIFSSGNNYSGKLRVHQETGLVQEITLSNSENQQLTYSFETQGTIDSNWLDTAEENIASISATTSNNMISITTQNDTIQSGSSILIIPARNDSTHKYVFDQTIPEDTTAYVSLNNGTPQVSYESESDSSSDFNPGPYTVFLLNPNGSEIKRFNLTM